jgi:orotate phosphoribosyltransferase
MKEVTEQEALELLDQLDAVWEGHFIGAKMKHLSAYVQKDVPTTYPRELRTFAQGVAWLVRDLPIDVIASPELGAIVLGAMVAEELDARFVIIQKSDGGMRIDRAAFREAVQGKQVGIVEDIITHGDTSRSSIASVVEADAEFVFLSGLFNRSGQTAELLGVEHFRPLVNRKLQDWPDKQSCELCANRVPIVLDVGHAEEFRAKNPDFDIEYVTRH